MSPAEPKRTKIVLAGVSILIGLLFAFFALVFASQSGCGLFYGVTNDCAGNHYGLTLSPSNTIVGLVLAGIFASIGFFVGAKIVRAKTLIIIGVIALLFVPVIGGFMIGSDWAGYPKNICISEDSSSAQQYVVCGKSNQQLPDSCNSNSKMYSAQSYEKCQTIDSSNSSEVPANPANR